MTYHDINQAISNIAYDLEICELILISASRRIDNKVVDYNLYIGMQYSSITIQIERMNNHKVIDYRLDTIEKTEKKLKWLLRKYDLNISSITYVNDYYTADIVSNSFSSTSGKLEYCFQSSPTGPKEEVSVNFHVYDLSMDFQNLIDNYRDFIEMLNGHMPPPYIILPTNSPQNFVRQKKLISLEIM